MKNGLLWQPRLNSTSAPAGSALASVATPGWNGSPSPDAIQTGRPASAAACVTASSAAKSLAEA